MAVRRRVRASGDGTIVAVPVRYLVTWYADGDDGKRIRKTKYAATIDDAQALIDGRSGTVTKMAASYRAELRWTTDEGTEYRKTKTARTLKEAQRALSDLIAMRDGGQDPTKTSKTVADLMTSWHRFKSTEVTKSTSEQYRYAIVHLTEGLGSVPLPKLKPELIDKFLRSKLDAGLSPRYVKLLRTVLSMALDQGVKWGSLPANPARYSASIKQTQQHGRSLSEAQAREFLEFSKDDRLFALWVLLLALGLRRGEALALSWEDYDRKARTLHITKNRKKEGSAVVVGELKTASSRRLIPLPAFVCQQLDRHRDIQRGEMENLLRLGVGWKNPGAMFANSFGGYLDPDNVSGSFKRLAARAGIKGWPLHELRHSAASLMLAQGVGGFKRSAQQAHLISPLVLETLTSFEGDHSCCLGCA